MTRPVHVIAQEWIGTPYRHQAARKGAGCDCLGLIRGVWAEASGEAPLAVPAYTPDWSEPQGDEALWRGAKDLLEEKPIEGATPGDVLLFRMRHGAVAKHLGLLTRSGSSPRFIHSYAGHGVVENSLSLPWRRRLVGCFAFPTLT